MSGSGQSVTTAFVDLATFDEIEKYMYGGPDATAYFVRESRKSTWFSQVPVQLSVASGTGQFGQSFTVNISRAGDYLLHSWLRVTVPEITLLPTNAAGGAADGRIRWCANFMHNLIKECQIKFNDLPAARFDNYHLDFWTAFTVPAGKRNGYDNMIGNFDDMTGPHGAGDKIPSFTLNLPLPFWFARDTGVALPTAALPYNEMRILFEFRTWQELLILADSSVETAEQRRDIVVGSDKDIATIPALVASQVWANYAIVSNDERKKMACAARDILIEQVQTAPKSTHSGGSPHLDIRFSHSIKALFFAVRNTTWKSEWSNYTTHSPDTGPIALVSPSDQSVDPILETTLCYENTNRLNQMGSDYFSLVNPYYHAVSIPTDTGYHMYSYSLDFTSLDPMGSTNYGKLTNVSIMPTASKGMEDALSAADDTPRGGGNFPQTFETVITAVNNNIIRISGGALGFPVL